MEKMIITRGLPASGKSTFASSWVTENPAERVEINRDNFRTIIAVSTLGTKEQEDMVTAMSEALMNKCFAQGKSIVVSNMNLRARYVKDLVKKALDRDYQVELKDFVVDIDELVKRDSSRATPVGENVIRDLARRFPYKNWLSLEEIVSSVKEKDSYVPYVNNRENPHAIIVDIDGTLAHHEGVRDPYDFSKVYLDKPDSAVIDAVRHAQTAGMVTIVVSGRSDACYDSTVRWLRDNGVKYDHLFMRKDGDVRADWIVKDEIIRTHIQDNFFVAYCLDDRDQVVNHNRNMGYKVFQVQPGDF